MQVSGYLVFHLNLAFSSIAENVRSEVIKTCYHPLLRLVEKTNIPVGVELTGWTLKQIIDIDPAWISRFKSLLKKGQCELIGSGYCQIIGPLVPYDVNAWNQRLGINEYQRLLGVRPEIVLVNEMAYSSSLVELYTEFGYKGLIIDRDNVRLALGLDGMPMCAVPTHAQGVTDAVMPVLWADSILFQKIQYYAHGDIAKTDYLDYLKKRIGNGETLLPVYCNDAEVFDYRPGRFSYERQIHPAGEWNRLQDLMESITEETEMVWVSPTQALNINNKFSDPKVSQLTSAVYPIPVKKQAKYNVNRWAVTGKNDLWLNTKCHYIAQHMVQTENVCEEDWRKLCEFWASDYRTHIEKKRWKKINDELDGFYHVHRIAKVKSSSTRSAGTVDKTKFQITEDNDGIYLSVRSSRVKLVLNMRRGLAIKLLSFKKHNFRALVGSLPHGYYQSIAFGADYYSGNLVAELPTERIRVTDLEPIKPILKFTEKGLEISGKIKTKLGVLHKKILIEQDAERISVSYLFDTSIQKYISSIRAGAMTFLPECLGNQVEIITTNGGMHPEKFILDRDFDHSAPASTLVSSSAGFGSTNGEIIIQTGNDGLRFSWIPAECACMPLLQYRFHEGNKLLRLFFSISEIDDTAAHNRELLPFCVNIQPS